MSEYDNDDIVPHGYWPSVTDLFLTLFIVAIAMLAAVFYALLPTNNVGKARAVVQAVGSDLENIREPTNQLRLALKLTPIQQGARPAEIITKLSETSDTAVSELARLNDTISDLQKQLKDLMGDADQEALLESLQKEIDRLKRQLADTEEKYQTLLKMLGDDPESTLLAILQENADLKRQLHDKPPIIRIDEQKEEYRFESGSSIIGDKFSDGLKENEFPRLANEIIDRLEDGRVKVDTLEIIGHTDGVPLSRRGNLDQKLPDLLSGESDSFKTLVAGSNNDLGLLRALAVKQQWQQYISSHPQGNHLKKLSIRCYSAGQTILPDDVIQPTSSFFKEENPKARRIEMRLTRLKDGVSP